MNSRPRLRMLHTSDVHLGAYDHSGGGELERMRQRLHDSFRSVVDLALREQADLLVVAGDFIDNARVRRETLEFAAAEISRAGMPVVITPGNHDHVGPGTVYDRIDFRALAPNLRLMRSAAGETVALEQLDVELWGRAHTEQDPRFSPFGDAPPRGDAAWQIAVGHGPLHSSPRRAPAFVPHPRVGAGGAGPRLRRARALGAVDPRRRR